MDYLVPSRRPLIALKRFLYFLLWIIELLLLAEFLVKLAGFNPAAPFTAFMTNLTASLMWPFQNLYPPTAHQFVVIDWSILIAMVIYQLVFYILISLLDLIWPKG